jgi:tRNA(fMet)-specific endonuclease VapC
MRYLIDTNILINLLRNKPHPLTPTILSEGAAISVITYAELLVGTLKSNQPDNQQALINQLIADFDLHIITLDQQIIKCYSNLRFSLESSGIRLEDFNLLIAATAISHKLTLITGNTKHFTKIPNLDLSHTY